MGKQVTVHSLPYCDFCAQAGLKRLARYDGKTRMGPWASMCPNHFAQYGIGLGTGRGQELVLKSSLNDFVCLGDNGGKRDDTEGVRRLLTAAINQNPEGRKELEAVYGQVWDTAELQRDFEVLGFLAPFVLVRRRSDGKEGSLMFQHDPRFYFDLTWKE